MLVNSNDILYMSKNGLFGIGEFYASDAASARTIINTALRCNMPVIIGMSEDDVSGGDADKIIELASASFIPVVVQFESDSLRECLNALEKGFTSVMLDSSGLPFEENIESIRILARAAHEQKASCEGQCSPIPRAEDTDPSTIMKYYTDLETAQRFVSETDVDVLSVCAGNAPGNYPYRPFLNVNKIIELSQGLSLPLSMHGTSGLHPFDLLHAVGNGICQLSCRNDIKDPRPITDPGQTDNEYIHNVLDGITDPVEMAIASRIVLYQNR